MTQPPYDAICYPFLETCVYIDSPSANQGNSMRPVILFLLLMSTSVLSFAAPQSDLDARRKALNDLLAERWEYTLRTSPIFASILGDKLWNDKLDDFSQQAIEED